MTHVPFLLAYLGGAYFAVLIALGPPWKRDPDSSVAGAIFISLFWIPIAFLGIAIGVVRVARSLRR